MAALTVPAISAGTASAETTWLCKPGLAADPCESSEETTVEAGDGTTSVEHANPASNPPIDCFYVYPTVSSQLTENANLEIGPEETQVAIDQASRFSQQCKVYAPVYPQITVHALENPEGVSTGASVTAYIGVFQAFEEYMSRYNAGRGFVLIGHSQGALMLKHLIADQIDPNAAVRARLVSSMLLGGNVLVPKGGTVGGDFQNIPACQSAGQTHCVVAYSSFLNEPPEGAYFGRVNSPLLGAATSEQLADDEVLCVNPALAVQGAGSGPLLRYESTTPLPGFTAPPGPTPWVSMPGQYSGQCEHANGASWLQLTDERGAEDKREQVAEVLGPLWGTHLQDMNIALGNLVAMTAFQSASYRAESSAGPPPTPPVFLSPPVPSTGVTSPPPTGPSPPPATPSPAKAPVRVAAHKPCKLAVKSHRRKRKPAPACAKHKRTASKHKLPARKHKQSVHEHRPSGH